MLLHCGPALLICAVVTTILLKVTRWLSLHYLHHVVNYYLRRRQARVTEDTLLQHLPPSTALEPPDVTGGDSHASPPPTLPSSVAHHQQATTKSAPANIPHAPYVLSRSHTTIELLPKPFPPSATRTKRSGWSAGDLVLASNATSTGGRDAGENSGQAMRRVAKVQFCVVGLR